VPNEALRELMEVVKVLMEVVRVPIEAVVGVSCGSREIV
jgi:hypothetical protein